MSEIRKLVDDFNAGFELPQKGIKDLKDHGNCIPQLCYPTAFFRNVEDVSSFFSWMN